MQKMVSRTHYLDFFPLSGFGGTLVARSVILLSLVGGVSTKLPVARQVETSVRYNFNSGAQLASGD